MNLSDSLKKTYTQETLRAPEAQRLAQFIAWGPEIFQVSRIMVKWGILAMLRESESGMTIDEVTAAAGKSRYAVQCLLEASLSIGIVLVDADTNRFRLSKTGWFLLTDKATLSNMNFNHDVCYEGMFRLEEALEAGKPAGLAHFGSWPTIYEGLSSFPPEVKKSWFGFDHFYSDGSFEEALRIVFASKTRRLMDVGGNTGRWAMQCVNNDPDVKVTVVDLPQQLEMMRTQTEGQPGAERIDGYATDLLDDNNALPAGDWDVIWMSQFLDCFSEPQVVSILRRAARVMSFDTRLCIMETFWDRQRYETAALCLTQTSLYFSAMANGNSKMFHSDDLQRMLRQAGLRVEQSHDHLGLGHSILVCKKE